MARIINTEPAFAGRQVTRIKIQIVVGRNAKIEMLSALSTALRIQN